MRQHLIIAAGIVISAVRLLPAQATSTRMQLIPRSAEYDSATSASISRLIRVSDRSSFRIDDSVHHRNYVRNGVLIGAGAGLIAGVIGGSYLKGGCPLQSPLTGQPETACSGSSAHLKFMFEGGVVGAALGVAVGAV